VITEDAPDDPEPSDLTFNDAVENAMTGGNHRTSQGQADNYLMPIDL